MQVMWLQGKINITGKCICGAGRGRGWGGRGRGRGFRSNGPVQAAA